MGVVCFWYLLWFIEESLSSNDFTTLIPFLLSLKFEYLCFSVSWESKQQKIFYKYIFMNIYREIYRKVTIL